MGVRHALGFFLTWWGAYLLGTLDATMLFFLPFGIDALVIYLAARDGMSIVVAVIGSAISGTMLWRSTRQPRLTPA